MWRYSVMVQQLITVTEGDADGGAEKAVMIVSIRDVWPTGQNILTTASLFLEYTLLAHKTKWHFGSYLFIMDWIICSIRGRQFDPPKRVVECCSLEILRRGGLILFCDYVVKWQWFIFIFFLHFVILDQKIIEAFLWRNVDFVCLKRENYGIFVQKCYFSFLIRKSYGFFNLSIVKY